MTTINLNHAKEVAKTLREMNRRRKEFSQVSSEVTDTVKPLKRLIGEPAGEANAKGSRLIAAGIALIAFPDPTISDLAGATLVAAGVLKNRMQQPTAADVYKELQKISLKLNSLRCEL